MQTGGTDLNKDGLQDIPWSIDNQSNLWAEYSTTTAGDFQEKASKLTFGMTNTPDLSFSFRSRYI